MIDREAVADELAELGGAEQRVEDLAVLVEAGLSRNSRASATRASLFAARTIRLPT
jgi:hypothetical protein